MKSKILLPIITAALSMSMFAACSDDSSSPSNPTVNPDNPVVDPSNPEIDPNTPVVDPNNPVVDPNAPVVDPNTPVVDPNTPVVDPNTPVVNPNTPTVELDPDAPKDANGKITSKIFDDSGLAKLPNNDTVHVDNKSDYNYYGAELSGKDQFTYGRFEARMKMASISGSVSSMFLYYDNSYMLEDEPWNEIDIEVLGRNPGQWQSNIITRYPNEEGQKAHKNITSEYIHQFGDNSTENFHLFGMIWTPEYIAWEIDSVEIRRDYYGQTRTEKNGPEQDQVAFMTMEQSLRFNLWSSASTGWVGKFTGGELADGPVEQLIDYVRVYDYDPATKGFVLNWQDDFDGDALDKARWKTGNWKMENVMLSPNNVVVADGYCKLLLSRVLKTEDTAK
ncbi:MULTISPECIES: family 16 glycosylhydrolase [unclassified Fibrobacter]|uniref:family 16 glycosylhydrolase n=1 Tax=unclassified Fibrobacter TaxID=2634177 RepID=UPI000D6BD9CC|nr:MULTISPECIES: family 16 glycosylhydrolase [unclassified Fibrobacter]PWJ68163.1 glycosyl hydrolase family 16 [Fibrobacter sp. UWR4]PZW71898.1 glycosyl hydrolase family 16 [Fibrobacter sp. UWR1]